MIENMLAVATGKGGAGKSSVAAHLAGYAAAQGRSVLLIDLDPQATLAYDLGYIDDPDFDGGEELAAALLEDRPIEGVLSARPGLDVVSGGDLTTDLTMEIGRLAVDALDRALGPLAGTYDLVVADSPPSNAVEARLALVSSRAVLVPTVADDSGLRAIEVLGRQLGIVEAAAPGGAEVLGVVLFRVAAAATRVAREAVASLEEFGDLHVFTPPIRELYGVARALRDSGRLAWEYIEEAEQTRRNRFAALAAGKSTRGLAAVDPTRVRNLAADYEAVSEAVLKRWDRIDQ